MAQQTGAATKNFLSRLWATLSAGRIPPFGYGEFDQHMV
ncbi:hypothetical protein B224_5423 [Aeromonas media WS]|nr:hypothetical protein B224_5423 [Aeromonas media WS]